MKFRCVLITLAMLTTAGCSVNHGRYALLSNKGITLSEITAERLASAQPASGESTCFGMLIFPFKFCSLSDAVNKALGSGDVLTDVTISYEQVNLFPIIISETWKVNGKAIKTGR